MTEDTAKIVIVAGAFVGCLVWLVALACYRSLSVAAENEFFEARLPGRSPEEAISAVVEQVRQFAAYAKFTRPTPLSFTVEQFGILAHFAAERAGGETRLVVGLDDSKARRRVRLVMSLLTVVLMPAVIFGLAAALWIWVAPSPQQGVRWQAVQILQIVHVLWPPFAVFFAWRQTRRRLGALVSNLIVLAEAG